MVKFPLVLFISVKDPETFFRVNYPPVCCVEIEQVMPNDWPQVTSPVGADIWGVTRETANKEDDIQNMLLNLWSKIMGWNI